LLNTTNNMLPDDGPARSETCRVQCF